MNKIKRPAIKESSGKVVEAKKGSNHNSIGLKSGQRGFTTTGGGFVNRSQGSKVAKSAGQSKSGTGKLLYSEQLKTYKK